MSMPMPAHIQVPPVPSDFVAPKITSAHDTLANILPIQPKPAHSYTADARSGAFLAEHLANKRMAPASLTNLRFCISTTRTCAKSY